MSKYAPGGCSDDPDAPDAAAQIICCRAPDAQRRPIPGSETRSCVKCGQTVVVSPATLARPEARNPKSVFVCVECAELEGVLIRPPTDAQREELRALGLDPDAWALREAWGKRVTRT